MDTPAETDVRCFLATGSSEAEPEPAEPDLEARFVPLAVLSELRMRPDMTVMVSGPEDAR